VEKVTLKGREKSQKGKGHKKTKTKEGDWVKYPSGRKVEKGLQDND